MVAISWSRLWLGLVIALVTFASDQTYKWWMLGPFAIAERGRVEITPFFDLTLTWNKGVSYGWFSSFGESGRWFLVGLSLLITAVLIAWLMRATNRMSAVCLGLAIGGALGNILDRVLHGAVADFFLFHAFGFSWYVFNLADMAIVAGVAGLLYSSFFTEGDSGTAGAGG